jgi:hypothetical protein
MVRLNPKVSIVVYVTAAVASGVMASGVTITVAIAVGTGIGDFVAFGVGIEIGTTVGIEVEFGVVVAVITGVVSVGDGGTVAVGATFAVARGSAVGVLASCPPPHAAKSNIKLKKTIVRANLMFIVLTQQQSVCPYVISSREI